MKKIIGLFSLIIIVIMNSSCQETKDKISEAMKQELFDLHDTIMPKSMKIEGMKAKLDSMSTDADSANIANIKALLDRSNSGMMEWMHQFDLQSLDSMELEEKIIYLKDQISLLKEVNQLTDSSFQLYEDFQANK